MSEIKKIEYAKTIQALNSTVRSIYFGSDKVWPKDFSQEYLTITADANNCNVGYSIHGQSSSTVLQDYKIQYSYDRLTWTDLLPGSYPNHNNISRQLSKGQCVYLRGEVNSFYNIENNEYCTFHLGSCRLSGNIMSLKYGSGTFGALLVPSMFEKLFSNNISLNNASNLVLPATTLQQRCYAEMFYGCTSLTTAPVLSATTLANQCYAAMFYGCTALTTAPELPATTLANYCYADMFSGCSSLTTAPSLSATTLAASCYIGMFSGCTSLNYIECLATDISATNCTVDWVYNVASTGTFVKDANMTAWTRGEDGIPTNWTIQNATSVNHSINIDSSINHGTVTTDKNTAAYGETVTITATPDAGYRLVSISVTAGGQPITVTNNHFTMPANNVIVSATFTAISYNVTINSSITHGTVTTDKNTAITGETVTITTTPDTGYELTSISVTAGGQSITVTNNQFTMPAANVTVSATFNIASYTINIDPSITHGTVTTDKNTAAYGETVTITSTPDSGYMLYSITVTASGQPITVTNNQFTMPADNITVSATFVNDSYTITINSGITHGSISVPSTAAPGSIVTISSTPDTDYMLDELSLVGSSSGTTTVFKANQFTMPAENVVLNATFSDTTNMLFIRSTVADNTLYWNVTDETSTNYDIYWSSDRVNWTAVSGSEQGTPICTLNSGQGIYVKGNLGGYSDDNQYNYFSSTGKFQLGSSIKSLALSTNYHNSRLFQRLFKNSLANSGPQFWLNAEIMGNNCYNETFANCTEMTRVPYLLATYVSPGAYMSMFSGCTKLTTAPSLPATTLAMNCYRYMFQGCIALTTVTSLPATTLAQACYSYMFSSCTSLTTVPSNMLPAATLADFCYDHMFNLCSSLTSTPSLTATTLADDCYDHMFSNCTSLTALPSNMLPATTLADYCYYHMFGGCTSLTTVPSDMLPATTLEQGCYAYMFYNCTSLTASPELPATTLVDNCYQGMFSYCSDLRSITCLATNISATECTFGWVYNVAYSGTFVKNANMLNWSTGMSAIPSHWTVKNYGQLYKININQTTNGTAIDDKNGYADYGETVTITATPNQGYQLDNITVVSNGVNIPVVNNQFTMPEGDVTVTVTFDYNYSELPLTFEALENNVSIKASGGTANCTIYYQINNGTVRTFNSTAYNSNVLMATLNAGDKMTVTGTLCLSKFSFANSTGRFKIYGNILSLDNRTAFSTEYSFTTTGSLRYMFQNCTGLTDAGNLIIQPTTMRGSDCSDMFYGCISLTTAPALPATTLAANCYQNMFSGCTSLTTAPALPATTLANYCYLYMFRDCTSLTTAPALPATALATECYRLMFRNCTSLTTLPSNMLPATTLSQGCYSNMFYGCTSLTTAPVLPATTLVNSCYYQMFYGCTSLNYIKCLATNISAPYCTNDWVNGVASTGTFVKSASMNNWLRNVSGIPSGWTVSSI